MFPCPQLTTIYKKMKVCNYAIHKWVFDTANFTREKTLNAMRRQFSMAENVQDVEYIFKSHCKKNRIEYKSGTTTEEWTRTNLS